MEKIKMFGENTSLLISGVFFAFLKETFSCGTGV
jgi:hypothetical protein